MFTIADQEQVSNMENAKSQQLDNYIAKSR